MRILVLLTPICLIFAAAICVRIHADFLRFDELAFLRCCDVKFCYGKYVELFVAIALRVRLIFIEMVMLLCWPGLVM